MKAVYRVVSAALALCVIPAAYFSSLFRINLSTSFIDTALGEEFSIHRLLSFSSDFGSSLDGMFSGASFTEGLWAAIEPIRAALICFVVFYLLAVLIALAAAIVSAASGKRAAVVILGSAGIICMIGVFISFNKLSTPLLDGSLSVGTLLNIPLIGSLIEVSAFTLLSAPTIMLILFIAVVLWTVSFYITEIGENPGQKKKTQKAKKKR